MFVGALISPGTGSLCTVLLLPSSCLFSLHQSPPEPLACLWTISRAASSAMFPLQQDLGREGRCVPKQDSWDAERFAGRASCPVPPHLVTTIHPLLCFLLSCMDQVPLGHSQVEISPEEEEDPLWSAPFPGALLSGFQGSLGTFSLMSPSGSFSLSSWSSGKTIEPWEAWTCFPAFSVPTRACT